MGALTRILFLVGVVASVSHFSPRALFAIPSSGSSLCAKFLARNAAAPPQCGALPTPAQSGGWGSAAAAAAGVAVAATLARRSRVTAHVTATERMKKPDFNPTPPEGLRQISGGIIGDHDVLEMDDSKAVAELACRRVADALAEAIKWRGSASLALPGGSVMAMMGGLVDAVHGGKLVAVDWTKVHLAFVNHKCVALDDESSNHRKALEIFAKKLGIPSENIVAPGGSSDGRAEASSYQSKLLALDSAVLPKDEEGIPVFDVLLLGVGADGHVGSLYPGRLEVTLREGYVLHVEQEGKPPSITLSLPVINAAKDVLVIAMGSEKAKALKTALQEDAGDSGKSCPAQAVHPKEDSTWILDRAAAEMLHGVPV
mmetsp:Transcript_19331/g.41075  ORF Transcript_19331/g.41075 Transcript_19331/m.41075 type:complete len:371 (+) Transcript_19331:92-1204(+)